MSAKDHDEPRVETPVERADAFWRCERRAAPQGHAAAPQVPGAKRRNSTEDEAAEAASQRKERPDTGRRVLVATIVLIVVLSWINGCANIWALAESPLP